MLEVPSRPDSVPVLAFSRQEVEMPRRKDLISLPSFPGIVLKEVELAAGYEFGKPRGSEIDVFKKKTRTKPRVREATLQCQCSTGKGDCIVISDDHHATCGGATCTGPCTWVWKVSDEAFVQYLGQVFRQ